MNHKYKHAMVALIEPTEGSAHIVNTYAVVAFDTEEIVSRVHCIAVPSRPDSFKALAEYIELNCTKDVQVWSADRGAARKVLQLCAAYSIPLTWDERSIRDLPTLAAMYQDALDHTDVISADPRTAVRAYASAAYDYLQMHRNAVQRRDCWRGLCDLIGHWQDGSHQTVTIGVDDATRDYVLKVEDLGKRKVRYTGRSLAGAVQAAFNAGEGSKHG